MLSAIQKETISECHLFAIFLIFLRIPRHERNFEIYHKQGFATILRRLVAENQNPTSTVVQGAPRLTFLWHYSLTFLCRIELGQVYTGRNLVWELHDAVEELRHLAILPDNRSTKDFQPLFWEENISRPDWLSLVCSIWNDKAILCVCLERVLRANAGEPRTWSKVTQSMTFIKRRLVAMGNLPCVQNLLYRVCLQVTIYK
jgi:hypothetical protein